MEHKLWIEITGTNRTIKNLLEMCRFECTIQTQTDLRRQENLEFKHQPVLNTYSEFLD